MLHIDSKNTNFNGVSIINNISFASFSATINETDNNSYINFNINNTRKFRENIAAIKADFLDFIDQVMEIVSPSEDDEEILPLEEEPSQSEEEDELPPGPEEEE